MFCAGGRKMKHLSFWGIFWNLPLGKKKMESPVA
jgi:hypothetical protein